MTIKEMHFEFKKKLNKIDSQKFKNLLVPEIDWALNESQMILIKSIAEPRFRNNLGFEVNNRTIEDIRNIVVEQDNNTNSSLYPNCLSLTKLDNSSFYTALPINYMYYINARAIATKNNCTKYIDVFTSKHEDKSISSSFYNSSFEFEESFIRFNEKGIKIFSDSTFDITTLCMDYIRKPLYMHNAEDFKNVGYNTLNGTTLTGFQNCELSEVLHNEIVDIAVQLTTIELDNPNYQFKKEKTNLNN